MKKLTLTLLAGIILAVCPINNIQATQTRTYTEDMHGRTLIYPSEKSLWNLALSIPITALGITGMYLGYQGNVNNVRNENNLTLYLGGALFTGLGAWLTYNVFHNRYNLHIPIIMLTQKGIWYNGKMKYNWDEVTSIDLVDIQVRNEYGIVIRVDYVVVVGTNRKNFLGIQETFKIDQDEISISREKLQEHMKKYWNTANSTQSQVTEPSTEKATSNTKAKK